MCSSPKYGNVSLGIHNYENDFSLPTLTLNDGSVRIFFVYLIT